MAGFDRLRPMLCASAPMGFDDPAYRYEPKLDGVRLLAHTDAFGQVRLRSRTGEDHTRAFPEVVDAVAQSLDGVAAVLDGEVCLLDERGAPDFAGVLSRLGRRAPGATGGRATFFVFDLLALWDEPVMKEPLELRRETLRLLLPNAAEGIQLVEFLPGRGTEAFDAAVRLGFEGIVAKRIGSPYRPGVRSGDWVKVKRADRADLVVGGWIPGSGSLTGTLGSLLVGAYDEEGRLRLLGRVGSGLTLADRAAFLEALRPLARDESPFEDPAPPEARFVRPRLVVEVGFLEITRGGKLRAPTFGHVRPDKPPEACRLTPAPHLPRNPAES